MTDLEPLSLQMEEDMQSSLDDMSPIVPLEETDGTGTDFNDLPLPDFLKHLRLRTGLASFHGGRLMLCEPELLAPVANAVLAGDPDFDPAKTHIYAYSAFGRLIAWNEDHWSMEIDMIDGIVSCGGLFKPEKKRNPETNVMFRISGFQNADLDLEDDSDKMVFSRIKKKLGPLAYGECYGFFPALPLGGAVSVESARKVQVREHFAMLAGLLEFRLRDYSSRPTRDVRLIGQ